MPYHSSTNFYKAEQETMDRKYRERWEGSSPSKYWFIDEDNYIDDEEFEAYHEKWEGCYCLRSENCDTCNPHYFDPRCMCCNHYYPYCKYYCKDASCDLCYEYMTTDNRKKLIEDWFTPQQILETLQDHLLQTNCWCYNQTQNAIKRDRIHKHIRTRRCSTDVFIPTVFDKDHIPPCIVKILDKKLGKEFREYHRQRELYEKIALLAKYNLTLDDYLRFRRERPDICNEPTEPELVNALPKQKFIKVKESTLQVGSF